MPCNISMNTSNSGGQQQLLPLTMNCSGGHSGGSDGSSGSGISSSISVAVVATSGLLSSSAAIDILPSATGSQCTSLFTKLTECSVTSSLVCLDYSSSFGSITSWGTSHAGCDEDDKSSDDDDDTDDDDEGVQNEGESKNKTDGTKSDEEEDWLCFFSNSPSNFSPNTSQLLSGRILLGGESSAVRATQKVIPGAKTTSVQINHCGDQEDTIDGCSGSGGRTPNSAKKVHFNDVCLVQEIKFEDDNESQEMRQPYWEVFARDRSRFNERIIETEKMLTPVLKKEHRAYIYNRMNDGPWNTISETAIKLLVNSNNNNLAESNNMCVPDS